MSRRKHYIKPITIGEMVGDQVARTLKTKPTLVHQPQKFVILKKGGGLFTSKVVTEDKLGPYLKQGLVAQPVS